MPVGNSPTVAKPGSRLRELGLVLPEAPTPLGAYVEQGREAVRIAAMNDWAVAQQHLGDLDRLKKLVKLSVALATTAG
jgi:hypothetical protein